MPYRTPLSPELREVLEVAYVSKIMSKNFRKEGQPEKERIANITGMDLEKVMSPVDQISMHTHTRTHTLTHTHTHRCKSGLRIDARKINFKQNDVTLVENKRQRQETSPLINPSLTSTHHHFRPHPL